MPATSETLPALEQRLAERLLAFELLAGVEREAAIKAAKGPRARAIGARSRAQGLPECQIE